MKFLLVAAFVSLPLSAIAHANKNLECVSNAKDPSVRKFTLSKLGTDKPEVTIRDAPFMEMTTDRGLIDLGFSSMCESSYRLIFDDFQVKSLLSGKRKSIQGLFIYDNPALTDLLAGEEEPASDSVFVVCTVK